MLGFVLETKWRFHHAFPRERGDNAHTRRGLLGHGGRSRMCHSKSMKRWVVAFSPAGPRNYRLCFKVDCVPIMYARRGERRRGVTRQRETKGSEGKEGRRGDSVPEVGGRKRGKRDKDTPKVRAVQLTPPYWVWFYGLSSSHRLLELRHVIRWSVLRGRLW